MAEDLFLVGGGGGGAGADLTIGGNHTSGGAGYGLISSGTLFLQGGNNVTLSQDGQSITISAGAIGAGSFSAGVSTGGNTLGDTKTVANVLVLAGGNNVTLSQNTDLNGATVTVSGPAMFKAGVSSGGNTAGDTKTVSNQVVLVGGSNISLSQATAAGGATVTINGPTQSVQPEGTVFFGVSSGGNTVGTTGLASGTGPRLVFVGGNNITLSQSIDAGGSSGTITISGANIGGAQTGISSIAADGTTYTSGQVVFVGSHNASVNSSAAGQTFIIDVTVPVQSVQTESRFNLTLAGNTSGALADISSGVLTLAGGNGITLSQLNNAVTISGPTPREAVSLAGNSTSAGAGYVLVSTGTLILAGGNNITLSQNGHSVTISGANAGGAQTGISGIAGSGASTVTAGTVQFANSNGISFGLNGSTMTASFSGGAGAGINASLAGNSTSAGAGYILLSSGTVTLAGGNNITLSQNGNAITISAPSGGGAGVSSGGNTAGTTGTVDYQLVFVGGSNISLSQSIDGGSGTITINGGGGTGANLSTVSYVANVSNVSSVGSKTGSYAIADHAHIGVGGVVASGIASTFVGNVVLSGGSNITLSTAGNSSAGTIAIHGGAGAALGMTNTGNTAGTVFTTGTGTVYFQGTNNITVSNSSNGSSQTLWISGPTGGGAGMGNSAVGTAGTSGSVGKQLYFYPGSNISLSQSMDAGSNSASLTIIGGAGAGGGATVNGSTGNVSFAAGNNMSLSTNGSTLTYINVLSSATIAQPVSNVSSLGSQTSYYALADHAHVGIAGVQASGTASTFVGNLMVSVGNNLTMSTGGNSSAGTIELFNLLSTSGIAQNVSNVSSAGTQSSRFAMADHAHLGVAGIVPNATASSFVGYVNLSAGNLMSLASGGNSSAGSLQIINLLSSSAQVQPVSSASSAGTNASRFALADHAHAGVFSGGVSNVGNTLGNTTVLPGRLVFSGGNNITLSQDTAAGNLQTIGIMGPDTHANVYNVVSGSGNTTGTLTSFSTGTMVFAGGTNITLSQSSNTITIVGPTGGGAGLGTGGGTSGTSGTAGKQLFFYAGSNIGLSQSLTDASSNSASLTINNLGAGTGFTTGSTGNAMPLGTHNSAGLSLLYPYHTRYIVPTDGHLSSISTFGQGSASIRYVPVFNWLTGTRIDGLVSMAAASAATTATAAIVISAWAAIYTRNVSTLSSLSSGSTQTTYTYASNSAGNTQFVTGAIRPISVPVNFNFAPGEYFVAFNMSTNTSSVGASTTNLGGSFSMMGAVGDLQTALNYAEIGVQTATSTNLWGGMGVYTAQTAGLPAAISLSAIAQTGTSLSQANIALVFRNG